MAAFGADEVIKLSPQVDWANKSLREILENISKIRKDKQYLDTLKMIEIEKLPMQLFGESKALLRSLADLTPNQINANKDVLNRLLVDSNSAVQRLEFELSTVKGNVVPRLLQITKNLDTAFTAANMGKKGGAVYLALKEMLDDETLERVTARGASTETFIPRFTPDFMPRLSEAIKNINYDKKLGIYTDGGAGRNIAALKVIGGYRNSDLARLDISSIDFNTGKISPTATKAGLASGQLSDAALDIVRAQVGGKFDVNGRFIPNKDKGSLFDVKITTNAKGVKTYTLKAASSINRHLTKALGQIDAWSPYSQKWGKKNVTLSIFRHLNETMWGETLHFAKTPVRNLATLRPPPKGFDASKYADPSFSPEVKVEANKVNAKLFGYMGHGTGADAMASFGYTTDQMSEETRKIIVGKDNLKNAEFKSVLNNGIVDPKDPKKILVRKGFYDNLPNLGGASTEPIQPIVAEALQRKTAAGIDLETEVKKGEVLDQQMENIEKDKTFKESQISQKLQNTFDEFSEKERTLFNEFKEALPDAKDDDIIKMVKSKNTHEAFWNFLDKYKGVRNLARLSKIFGGPAGVLITGGLTSLMYQNLKNQDPESFDQPEDSIGGYLQDFYDLTSEEIQNKRLKATLSPNFVPWVGDAYEYAMSKIFPSTTERAYTEKEKDRKAAEQALNIETDVDIKEAYPEHTLHAGRVATSLKTETDRVNFINMENEKERARIAEKNLIADEELRYTNRIRNEDLKIQNFIKNTNINKPTLDDSTIDQTDKLFRPVIDTEENNLIQQQQLNIQGGI